MVVFRSLGSEGRRGQGAHRIWGAGVDGSPGWVGVVGVSVSGGLSLLPPPHAVRAQAAARHNTAGVGRRRRSSERWAVMGSVFLIG